ncbi:MAG TPA: nuclear transport factor 2 family protein [Solirubrobacteraceae bacterium]|nr:nuclear transport factor 2 family protein [Solirubrobacteraceae bacterium]
MSQENVELIRRSIALATNGDWVAALDVLSPDIEWVVARDHPEARTAVGREAVANHFRAWQETVPGRLEVDRILERGDKVVMIGAVRATALGAGADLRVPIALAYTIKDGLVVRGEEYLAPSDALKAVGLEE